MRAGRSASAANWFRIWRRKAKKFRSGPPGRSGATPACRFRRITGSCGWDVRARKVATLTDTAPEAIAAGNIGCLMQIGAGTPLPVVHTVELLDWATGGPRPGSLPG